MKCVCNRRPLYFRGRDVDRMMIKISSILKFPTLWVEEKFARQSDGNINLSTIHPIHYYSSSSTTSPRSYTLSYTLSSFFLFSLSRSRPHDLQPRSSLPSPSLPNGPNTRSPVTTRNEHISTVRRWSRRRRTRGNVWGSTDRRPRETTSTTSRWG